MNNNFNFRQTKVYILAKQFRKEILGIIKVNKLDRILSDQINRASLSIILNIAEGFGRFHKTDKRNFYVIARGSVFECVACLDIIYDSEIPKKDLDMASELGKMLSGLIKTFS
jgi:four helix bundle protein